MTAPTNVWNVELEAIAEGVKGARLLDRPSGTRLVSAVWELDPGASSGPYHLHHATEELLLVLDGEPTLRSPEGERALSRGEVVHFPVGADGAHQVLNHSAAPVRYLMVAAHREWMRSSTWTSGRWPSTASHRRFSKKRASSSRTTSRRTNRTSALGESTPSRRQPRRARRLVGASGRGVWTVGPGARGTAGPCPARAPA